MRVLRRILQKLEDRNLHLDFQQVAKLHVVLKWVIQKVELLKFRGKIGDGGRIVLFFYDVLLLYDILLFNL